MSGVSLDILGLVLEPHEGLREIGLADASTIAIAVDDGVLADSLRFLLELEGFQVKLCDEHSLLRAMAGGEASGCLVLDHELFARIFNSKGERHLAGLGFPVVLMVNHKTEKVIASAERAGVTKVVEAPLLGGVLLNAIRAALNTPLNSTRQLN